MRIHTDSLTMTDIRRAADYARVDLDRANRHNSRSRACAFDISLRGESRRAPMGGKGPDGLMAATWDQWGVFLAVLFDLDNNLTIPRVYDTVEDFEFKTDERFVSRPTYPTGLDGVVLTYWPADAHGDHRFQFNGTPYQQECTKCSAVTRWRR